jgi:predicted nucleotidyltransferase
MSSRKNSRGPVQTRAAVLRIIKKLGPQLRDLKVTGVYLFGSFARGDAVRKSDIDVVVECIDGITLFDLSGVKLLLEEALGRRVDVVMREALRKEFREQVEKEMIRAA